MGLLMMYCEDCEREVIVSVSRDSIGDYGVIGGVQEFEVWTCSECGGENLRDKQSADPETGALPEGTDMETTALALTRRRPLDT